MERLKGKGSRSRATRAPCTPKLGRGTHLQHNTTHKNNGVYRGGQVPDTLRYTRWYTCRSRLWTCDDLRLDEGGGFSIARIPDRFVEDTFRLHLFGRGEPPETRTGFVAECLSQRVASAGRRRDRQYGELVDGRFREMSSMPGDLGEYGIALRLRGRDLLDTRSRPVFFQVEDFGMAASPQQKRGIGGTDETGHRTQQRLRSRSRATPSRSQMFVSMLGPNDVMARSTRFSDTKPVLTAD